MFPFQQYCIDPFNFDGGDDDDDDDESLLMETTTLFLPASTFNFRKFCTTIYRLKAKTRTTFY